MSEPSGQPLHPHLPQPPACVLMVSPVKTGKSTIISNLLLNEAFYGHEYFDDVFVISNTINNDQTSRLGKVASLDGSSGKVNTPFALNASTLCPWPKCGKLRFSSARAPR